MAPRLTVDDIVDEEKAKAAALATVKASSDAHDKPPVVSVDDRLAVERRAYQTDPNAYTTTAQQGALRLDQLSNLGGAGPTYKMPAAGGPGGTPAERYAEQLAANVGKATAVGDRRVAEQQGSFGSWLDQMRGISATQLSGLGGAQAARLAKDAQERAFANQVSLARGTTGAQSAELARLREKQGADRQAYDQQYRYQVEQQLKEWDAAMAALAAAEASQAGGGGGGGRSGGRSSGSSAPPAFAPSARPVSSAIAAYAGSSPALPKAGKSKPSTTKGASKAPSRSNVRRS